MSDSAAPHLVDLRAICAWTLPTPWYPRSAAAGQLPPLTTPIHGSTCKGLIDGLCELSLKDPLTGLANRRHFRAVLEREIDRVTRSGEVALLLMLDIDHFKKVNDVHGHSAGDLVYLQSVARTLSACVRPMDTWPVMAVKSLRWCFPPASRRLGTWFAERIRRAVPTRRFGFPLCRAECHREALAAHLRCNGSGLPPCCGLIGLTISSIRQNRKDATA